MGCQNCIVRASLIGCVSGVGEQLLNDEPEKVAREQPSYMARIQSASKLLIRDPGELNLPTISVEFDNTMSSLIPKHGELLEGENGLGKLYIYKNYV